MARIGLWLPAGGESGSFAESVGREHTVVVVSDEAGVFGEIDGMVAEASVLQRHEAALAARRRREAPVLFPVLALLPAGADGAEVEAALRTADEILFVPCFPAEARRRLRGLLEARRASSAQAEGAARETLERLAADIVREIDPPLRYVLENLEFLGTTFGRLVTLLDRLAEAAMVPGVPVRLAGEVAAALSDEDVRFLLTETPGAIEESREGLERVASIVASMGRIAETGDCASRPADVAEAVGDALAVTRGVWKYVAEARMDIEPGLPAVTVPQGMLDRVLATLVVLAARSVAAETAGRGGQGVLHVRAALAGGAVEVTLCRKGLPAGEARPADIGEDSDLACVNALVGRHHARLARLARDGEGTGFLLRLPIAGATLVQARSA